MAPEAEQILATLSRGCARAGLDLIQPFRVDWYNAAVEPAHRLPDFGRPGALGILIGNTNALWPAFVAALAREPARLEHAHPLDRYVLEAISQALSPIAERHEARYAHEGPPRLVSMLRLAAVSGLAHLSPVHLCIHPVYGPWFALRAAVVFDLEGPLGAAPVIASPCPAWDAESPALLARATAAGDWQSWLALRDSCPVGRAFRYDDAQIAYHYTKDRALLRGLVQNAHRPADGTGKPGR